MDSLSWDESFWIDGITRMAFEWTPVHDKIEGTDRERVFWYHWLPCFLYILSAQMHMYQPRYLRVNLLLCHYSASMDSPRRKASCAHQLVLGTEESNGGYSLR